MVFSATPQTRITPTLIPVASSSLSIQKFTFPYTRPYFPRTEAILTTTEKVLTRPPTTTINTTTRTTTRLPIMSTTVQLTSEKMTHESVPISRHTTYSPVKIWPTTRSTTPSTTTWVPTTPRKITWKHIRPTGYEGNVVIININVQDRNNPVFTNYNRSAVCNRGHN